MVQIEIHVPYPRTTLALLALAGWWVVGGFAGGVPEDAEGGKGQVDAAVIHQAEEEIRDLRVEREVLARRGDILRHQLSLLIAESKQTDDPAVLAQLDEARRALVALLKDDKEAEQELLASLRALWDAQGYAMRISAGSHDASGPSRLEWPVEPLLGISAHFHDDGYKKRFGFDHNAIDIPTPQGTIVFAPADGVVVKVSDNGMGFSSLSVDHGGGVVTLYGHVSEFLVGEGDRVYAGDPIARSGGTPGTKGAGHLTTGAHLHFEVFVDGRKQDPMKYMVPHAALQSAEAY